MSYYASYSGEIKIKLNGFNKAADKACEIFDEVSAYKNELDISGYSKFYGDDIEKFLASIAADTIEGELRYIGEDSTYWKYTFVDGEWKEYDGDIVYINEEQAPKEINLSELAGQLIDQVQDTLPLGFEIKGNVYDKLKSKLIDTLRNWNLI